MPFDLKNITSQIVDTVAVVDGVERCVHIPCRQVVRVDSLTALAHRHVAAGLLSFTEVIASEPVVEKTESRESSEVRNADDSSSSRNAGRRGRHSPVIE